MFLITRTKLINGLMTDTDTQVADNYDRVYTFLERERDRWVGECGIQTDDWIGGNVYHREMEKVGDCCYMVLRNRESSVINTYHITLVKSV